MATTTVTQEVDGSQVPAGGVSFPHPTKLIFTHFDSIKPGPSRFDLLKTKHTRPTRIPHGPRAKVSNPKKLGDASKAAVRVQSQALEAAPLILTAVNAVADSAPPAAASANQDVTTNGWDTVFGISLKDLNNVFVSNTSAQPHAFKWPEEPSDTNPAIFTDGKFGTWSFTNQSSGTLMHLNITIESGNFFSPLAAKGSPPIDLAGAEIFVEVNLQYVDHEPSNIPPPTISDPTKDPGTNKDLKIHISHEPTEPLAVTSSYIPSLEPGNTTDPMAPVNKSIVQGFFGIWMKANAAQVKHIFSIVNLNVELEKDDGLQWLRPTGTGYAFTGSIDDSETASHLAVLNMTEGRPYDNLAMQVDHFLVPQGSQAGFLINSHLFLEKNVLPGLPKCVTPDYAGDSRFKMDPIFTNITNESRLQLDDMQYAGTTYHTYVDPGRFILSIESGCIKVTMDSHTEISPGIVLNASNTSYAKLVLDKEKQTLTTVKQEQMSHNSHTVDVATGIVVSEIIIGVIGGLLSICAGNALEGIRKVLVLIAIAIVTGMLASVAAFEKAVTGEALANEFPGFALFTGKATETIKWTGGENFVVDQIFLAEHAFQMGGSIDFSKADVPFTPTDDQTAQ